MEKDKHLVFICQHCAVPQRITEHVISNYLINPTVLGFYCSNDKCSNVNFLSLADKRNLIEMVYGE
jgi:hypothetical protein